MSDHMLLCIGVALAIINVYISWRMAMALAEVKASADKTISDVKSSPLGGVLGILGFK